MPSTIDRTAGVIVLPPSPTRPWTSSDLINACAEKGIPYQETDILTSVLGFVTIYGSSARLSVRAGLPEAIRLAVLARGLGHVALGHEVGIYLLWETPPTKESARAQAYAEEAAIWAAYLLVRPDVWAHSLSDARETTDEDAQAVTLAAHQTATSLNIPLSVVELWLRHQGRSFQPQPLVWLQDA
jgi:hypothetical protein